MSYPTAIVVMQRSTMSLVDLEGGSGITTPLACFFLSSISSDCLSKPPLLFCVLTAVGPMAPSTYSPVEPSVSDADIELSSRHGRASSISSRPSDNGEQRTPPQNLSTEPSEDRLPPPIQHEERIQAPVKSLLAWWWLELGSISLSLAFMAALLGILVQYQNAPLREEWQEYFSIDPSTLLRHS